MKTALSIDDLWDALEARSWWQDVRSARKVASAAAKEAAQERAALIKSMGVGR